MYSAEGGDNEIKYLALLKNLSLLVLTLAVVNDPTVGVAGIEDVLDPLLVLYILQLSNSGISSLSSDSLSPPLS